MDDPTQGTTTIAPEVLLTIAQLTTLNVNGVSRLSHVQTGVNQLLKRTQKREGVLIEVVDDVVYADIYVVLKNDVNVRDVSHNIQHEISRAISEMVGMSVGRVNVHIEDIDYPEEAEA
ncbi:MAG: Asp23/Gls24 family envelope stress response protein [Acidobacteriaceae bacterium]